MEDILFILTFDDGEILLLTDSEPRQETFQ